MTGFNRFAGKSVIVTGAAGGIGRASALAFAGEGANVMLGDRDADRVEAVRREIESSGGTALAQPTDVASADGCRALVEATVGAFGGLDVLFNNAGITRRANVVDTTEEEWDAVMAVNVKSIFLMCKHAVPHLIARGGGAIVNTASGWGLVGGGDAVSYCASKGAAVLLTKAMAVDHGKDGIRVNCVCPGDTDTGMLRDEARQLGLGETALVEAGDERPLGRVGQPREIADAVLYLASEQASFVTGEAMVVDGGGLAGSS